MKNLNTKMRFPIGQSVAWAIPSIDSSIVKTKRGEIRCFAFLQFFEGALLHCRGFGDNTVIGSRPSQLGLRALIKRRSRVPSPSQSGPKPKR